MVERSGTDSIAADVFAEVILEERVPCALVSDADWSARKKRLRERGEEAEAEFRSLMNGSTFVSRATTSLGVSAAVPPLSTTTASLGGGVSDDTGELAVRRPSMVVINGVSMPQAGEVELQISSSDHRRSSSVHSSRGQPGSLGVGDSVTAVPAAVTGGLSVASSNRRRKMSFLSPADSFEMLEDIWKSSEESVLEKLHLLQRAYEKRVKVLRDKEQHTELTEVGSARGEE